MSAYSQQRNNLFKTQILIILFVGLTSLVFYGISYITNQWIFTWIGIILSLTQAFVSYYFGGSIAIASNGGKELRYENGQEIHNIVENLSKIAGIPKPKIFISPDPSANAFACGRDPEHANICINQGLIDLLNKNEIEGVIAHELAHIKNRDILVMTVTMILSLLIGFITDISFRFGFLFGNSKNSDENPKSPLIIVAYLILLVLAPILSLIISMAVSRQREFLADATAITFTRYPEGLISALTKLYNSPIPSHHYSTTTNHFFISPPKKSWGEKINNLFSTHPNIKDRVDALTKM
jgi:heat shock protein HtpX